jgi:hypothetical protein
MRIFAAAILALVLSPALFAGEASAFDTSYHESLTEDALDASGIPRGSLAEKLVQVSSWYADLFSLDPRSLALEVHFDNLGSPREVVERWERIGQVVDEKLDALLRKKDPRATLLLLGLVLHGVQDFYAHANWADVDWSREGFREDAIYEDIPRRVLLSVKDAKGRELHTGFWSLTGSAPPGQERHEELNKDHAKRPHHDEAYRMAARASRRWVERFREKLEGDPVLSFSALARQEDSRLEHLARTALQGAENVSRAVGTWDDSPPEKGATMEALRDLLPTLDDLTKTWHGLLHAYAIGLVGEKKDRATLEDALGNLEKLLAKVLEAATHVLGAGSGELGKSAAR